MSCHTECSEKSYLLSEPKTDNLKTTIQVLTFCCTNGFEAQSIGRYQDIVWALYLHCMGRLGSRLGSRHTSSECFVSVI